MSEGCHSESRWLDLSKQLAKSSQTAYNFKAFVLIISKQDWDWLGGLQNFFLYILSSGELRPQALASILAP